MIFVDPLMSCIPNRRWRWAEVSHLMDTNGHLQELHEFAERLGLRLSWFQQGKKRPHYDLTPRKRAQAIQLGAIEFSRTQTATVLRAYRLGHITITPPPRLLA